jgi:hypothetical protein
LHQTAFFGQKIIIDGLARKAAFQIKNQTILKSKKKFGSKSKALSSMLPHLKLSL